MLQSPGRRGEHSDLWTWKSWLGKTVIFTGTLSFGCTYPIVVAWSKQGKDSYPYMFSTAIFVKNILMLIFYSTNLYFEKNVPPTVAYMQTSQKEDDTGDQTILGDGKKENERQLDFMEKLRLSVWVLPNIILTLVCDVITFITMKYLSVASYTLILQSSTIWIVLARAFCLGKYITCPQSLAVTVVTLGVVGFQTLDFEENDFGGADSKGLVIGVILAGVRGLLKAVNMVYCEWFLQDGLKQLSFYEKQTAVAFWFCVSSFFLVLQTNGTELLAGREFLDNYAFSTWVYILLAAALGIWYYLLVRYLDALMMGICSMCSVPLTVILDCVLFGTEISSPQWIFALMICLGSFQYNLLKGYVFQTEEKSKK